MDSAAANLNELTNPSILRLDALSKRFGDRSVLRALSAFVPPQSLVGVVGPSGSGKTTLVRIIAGLEQPDAGRVFLGGRDITESHPRDRELGLLCQQPVLYPHMSVRDNVLFPMRARRLDRQASDAQVHALAKHIGIEHLLDRRPATLSGGERQRAALARTFACRSRLYLLDEPIKASLEPSLRSQLRSAVRYLHADAEATTLFVTHDHEEVVDIAQFLLLLLPEGNLFLSVEDAFLRPPMIAVARFLVLGNLLTAAAERHTIDLGRGPASVIGTDTPLPEHVRGRRLTWLVRRNQCRLGPNGRWAVTAVRLGRDGYLIDMVLSHELLGVSEPTSVTIQVPHCDRPPVGGSFTLTATPGSLAAFDGLGKLVWSDRVLNAQAV